MQVVVFNTDEGTVTLISDLTSSVQAVTAELEEIIENALRHTVGYSNQTKFESDDVVLTVDGDKVN